MSHSDQDVKGVLDSWQDKSAAERYARGEAATRPFAEILLQTSKLATAKLEDETYVLDIAAGTGAVEAAIYGALPKEKLGTVKVLGSDISQPMLDYLKARGEKEGWKGLETEIVDGNVSVLPFCQASNIYAFSQQCSPSMPSTYITTTIISQPLTH
jgi:ubiquinone/menaquinone biosynthesis C-methylase UbiE